MTDERDEPLTPPGPLTGDDLPEDVTVLRRLPHRDGQEWLIGLLRFRGKDYATARVYYVDDEGKLKPTRHGINVHEELLPEIISGLQAVDALLTERASGRA